MKVVFTSLFQPGMGGGAGRVAHELAEAFAREHQVVMICPQKTTGLQGTDRELQVFGVRSAGDDEFHMPVLSVKSVRAIFDFLTAFQPQIIHAHDPALIGLICQVWARMNRVPFVHTAHVLPSRALDFGTTDAFNVKLLKSNFSESITHRVLGDFYANCDAIIALNRTAEESIRDFGYQGQLYVIPNGRNLAKYRKVQIADPEQEEKTIAFVGYLNERKNQSYLLHVLRYLPEHYRLQLIGKALDPAYQKKLELIRDRYSLDRVEFLGQVPHEEIPDYLSRAHVFPSASQMEVQSLVIIEALASGTPVVGLSNETVDELVNERVGSRLPQDAEPEEFAAEIERVASQDPADYREMCRRARERVAQLDWSNIVHQTAEAYRELLISKPLLSAEESDILSRLVSFFTTGEVENFLTDKLTAYRYKWNREIHSDEELQFPTRLLSWIRVPTSTWLISGVTVLVSVFGYLFMKGKRR